MSAHYPPGIVHPGTLSITRLGVSTHCVSGHIKHPLSGRRTHRVFGHVIDPSDIHAHHPYFVDVLSRLVVFITTHLTNLILSTD